MLEEACGEAEKDKCRFRIAINIFVKVSKQMISSARQRTSTSVAGGQESPRDAFKSISHIPRTCHRSTLTTSATRTCSQLITIR
jgi:hypothetical protein